MFRVWARRRLAALLLAATGVVFALLSYRLGLWTGGSPDAGLMPLAASLLLAALAVLCVVAPGALPEAGASAGFAKLGSYIAAGFSLSVLPAAIGSLAAFAFAMWLVLCIGERLPVGRSALLAIALAVTTIALFRFALGVPLPDPLLDRLFGL